MKSDKVMLDHGSGGKISHRMTLDLMLPAFNNPILAELNDGAIFELQGLRLGFSTDSYTVDPIFFPGGNIGELAVYGTVNDLAMCGAEPAYLSAALIIEEGFPLDQLQAIVAAMSRAAATAGVQVVTGDTKVVPRGAADKIFINTSGVGVIPAGVAVASHRAKPGDLVLLSGSIADHGVSVLASREGLSFQTGVQSDTAPLNHMVRGMLAAGPGVHVLRDPTRGGLGTALSEIAEKSAVGVRIYEDRIPVKPEVAGLCELLGFDPLYLANEGKLIAFVAPEDADAVLRAMRLDPYGRQAVVIGEATAGHSGKVLLQTRIGGTRIVDMLAGEQLPRIC
ncbi:MAG TPA: hydrogenase expression/formation protein HypE [Desulfobacterales bacterium]|nr:hydrogenase expression/formation protein HypE [Desulfobacterales bacterium]